MQDIDFDLPIEIATQEIEEAEQFASEYRLAIDARQVAGHNTNREELLLERFLAAIRNAYHHHDILIHGQPVRDTKSHRPTLH